MTGRSETRETLGRSPQSFGRRLASLRVRVALSQQELADAVGVSRPEVANWEGGLSNPHPRNVEELTRFFLSRGSMRDYNEVFEFCLSAGSVPELTLSADGNVEVRRVGPADDRISSVGHRISGAYARSRGALRGAIGSSLAEGLQSINEQLRAIRPPTIPRLLQAERRLKKLRASRPQNLEGLHALRDELALLARSDCSPEDRFAAVRTLAEVFLAIHDYDGAVSAFQSAYYIGRSLHYAQLPWALESLARLCELVAQAHLSIGTREHWDAAEYFLREALGLRYQLREDLAAATEEGIQATLRSMLELARAESNRRDVERGERAYLELLLNPRVTERPFFHACVLKELGDNCRFAERHEEAADYFHQALALYVEAGRRSLDFDDPVTAVEVELNVAYCHGMVGREEESIGCYRRALEMAIRLRDRRRVGYACLQLARSRRIQEGVFDACTYLFAAMRIFEQTGAEEDLTRARNLSKQPSFQMGMADDQRLFSWCRERGLAEFFSE